MMGNLLFFLSLGKMISQMVVQSLKQKIRLEFKIGKDFKKSILLEDLSVNIEQPSLLWIPESWE